MLSAYPSTLKSISFFQGYRVEERNLNRRSVGFPLAAVAAADVIALAATETGQAAPGGGDTTHVEEEGAAVAGFLDEGECALQVVVGHLQRRFILRVRWVAPAPPREEPVARNPAQTMAPDFASPSVRNV